MMDITPIVTDDVSRLTDILPELAEIVSGVANVITRMANNWLMREGCYVLAHFAI